MARAEWELPFLLLGAFRAVIDELHAELAAQGYPGVRPAHGFALQAIGPDGVTISELGRRLGVSKQAAAKTVTTLEDLGYAVRAPAPTDARATMVRRTATGEGLLATSAEVLTRLHARLTDQLGADRVAGLEDALAAVIGPRPVRIADTSSWLT